MSDQHQQLDHAVWTALSESHQDFALAYEGVKFYHPKYGPFGAVRQPDHPTDGIRAYAELLETFYLVGIRPRLPEGLAIKAELPCRQMVLETAIDLESWEGIVPLTEAELPQLIDLIDLVQPGFFRSRTFDMGPYFGVFQDGRLVAATGERMRMQGYTEVSAVVTHPEHTRRGYARKLIAHTVEDILAHGQVPFLHVASDNAIAIRLYEKLGFRSRLETTFWQVGRSE